LSGLSSRGNGSGAFKFNDPASPRTASGQAYSRGSIRAKYSTS
jgi:hypothetical protein